MGCQSWKQTRSSNMDNVLFMYHGVQHSIDINLVHAERNLGIMKGTEGCRSIHGLD